MSMTIEFCASRKEAEDFIIANDLKRFGEPRIRKVVLSDKTIYRVNINNSGYKAYQDFMFAKRRPTQRAIDAAESVEIPSISQAGAVIKSDGFAIRPPQRN